MEADFLMLVEDQTRLGALRLRDLGGEAFQSADAHPVPPLVALPKLLGAARRVIDDKETDEDLRLLLAPGSSLGGARPKASVLDADGQLLMAKFPSQTDDWPIPVWESVAVTLAERAGVVVPPFQLRHVLVGGIVLRGQDPQIRLFAHFGRWRRGWDLRHGRDSSGKRQADRECRALAQAAGRVDLTVHQAGEFAADRQDADAVVLAGVAAVGLEEAVEQVRQIAFRDADPGVRDAEDQLFAVVVHLQGDTARRGELERSKQSARRSAP
jgi:hypothetical protein